MFALLLLLLAAGPAPGREEAAAGWIRLFDGKTLSGWSAAGGAHWVVADGVVKAEKGASGWLRTRAAFGDFRLKLEYRVRQPDARSGVALRVGPAAGYEVVIDDVDAQFPTGSIAGRARARPPKPVAGRWRALDVTARGTRITVRLDGRRVADLKHFGALHGAIGLKFNAGHPVEFRNVRLKPLDMACLFDGGLEQWRAEDGHWSARGGAVQPDGAGMLASAQMWDDFVLQVDVRSGGEARLYFRGEREQPGSGYEVRLPAGVLVEAASSAPAPPVGEWVTATLVARGRQINLWLDGRPMLNWRDERPEGLDLRKGEARLRRGVLRLQAGGGGTVFKDLCIAPLARR